MNALKAQLAVFERALIEAALHARKGNVSAAARDLGIDRTEVYRRRRKLARLLPPPSNRTGQDGAGFTSSAQQEGGFSHIGAAADEVLEKLRERSQEAEIERGPRR